jgi:hypothetical protein
MRAQSKHEGFFQIWSYIRGMMSSADKQQFDDQVLLRYLLGCLSEEEAERLDELSIADDAFAWRLNAVENDLVDAYVRGELSSGDLAGFKKSYLSSPKRMQKLEFAEALGSFDRETVTAGAQARPARTAPSPEPKEESSKTWSPRRWFSVPRLALQWGFAGGAVAMLFVASYLLMENVQLRKQTIEAQGFRATVGQREQELQQELNDQRVANAEMAKQMDGLRESQPSLDQLKTLSAVLLPPTRGAGQIPTLLVPPQTSLVVLVLALETDDFPIYRVGLRDPAANQILWHSANLQPVSGAENKLISISFPTRLLRSQNYVIELSGVSAKGAPELTTSYAFHAEIR